MDEFPPPPPALVAPIEAGALPAALAASGLDPDSSVSWSTADACYLAVNLRMREGIPYVTSAALLRSQDGGRTWTPLGTLEGVFAGVFLTVGQDQVLWSTWVIEGTMSTVYRVQGDTLQPMPALDEAVRARGGCCFTEVERLFFVDGRRGLVQVSGLEAGVEDPAGAEVGWFGTVDGGASWVWLGAQPSAEWRRVQRARSRAGPGCAKLP